MNNIERYNEEIRECKKYLTALSIAMNKLLEINRVGSKKKSMNKQQKMFEKLKTTTKDNKKFIKQFNSYKKKTASNLKKVNKSFYASSKIREFLDSRNSFSDEIISRVMKNFYNNDNLLVIINNISMEYKNTIHRIRNLEQLIETEKLNSQKREQEFKQRMEEYNKPKPTPEQLEAQRKKEEQEEYERTIERNSSKLLDGPKNAGIIDIINGKDVNLNAMKYLYGLAADIILLMSINQHVNIKNKQTGQNSRIWNADFYVRVPKEARDKLFAKYGVTSLESLLNKYEQIRNKFHKKYSKLSDEKKSKYSIDNFDETRIESSLVTGIFSGSLFYAMQNENFKYPPSKETLIELINNRIMNGKNYKLVEPQKQEVITGEAKDFKQYLDIKSYYKNLTKNMTIEQVSELYKRVVMDMHEGFRYSDLEAKDIKAYYAIMQKLFCEVIFDKKGMEYLDSKQKDQAIKEIAETILKEELDFSIYGSDKVTEEEQQKRQLTVQEEYVRYRANMTKEGKKDFLSFREFSKRKYNISNVVEPKNMEEMIKEEIKGMKK